MATEGNVNVVSRACAVIAESSRLSSPQTYSAGSGGRRLATTPSKISCLIHLFLTYYGEPSLRRKW